MKHRCKKQVSSNQDWSPEYKKFRAEFVTWPEAKQDDFLERLAAIAFAPLTEEEKRRLAQPEAQPDPEIWNLDSLDWGAA